MIKFEFNKLIRSKLPERMFKEGLVIKAETLSPKQYIEKLKQKLLEEAEEAATANSLEFLKKELADVLEVIHAIAEAEGLTIDAIEQERIKKREINGHFTKDAYIHHISVAKDNKKVLDYLANRDRPYTIVSN